jgi:hypothetical protein
MESVSEFLKMLLMVIVGGNEDGSKIMTLQPADRAQKSYPLIPGIVKTHSSSSGTPKTRASRDWLQMGNHVFDVPAAIKARGGDLFFTQAASRSNDARMKHGLHMRLF